MDWKCIETGTFCFQDWYFMDEFWLNNLTRTFKYTQVILFRVLLYSISWNRFKIASAQRLCRFSGNLMVLKCIETGTFWFLLVWCFMDVFGPNNCIITSKYTQVQHFRVLICSLRSNRSKIISTQRLCRFSRNLIIWKCIEIGTFWFLLVRCFMDVFGQNNLTRTFKYTQLLHFRVLLCSLSWNRSKITAVQKLCRFSGKLNGLKCIEKEIEQCCVDAGFSIPDCTMVLDDMQIFLKVNVHVCGCLHLFRKKHMCVCVLKSLFWVKKIGNSLSILMFLGIVLVLEQNHLKCCGTTYWW